VAGEESNEVARSAPALSLPGLTRQSILLREIRFTKKMDTRVKPAYDSREVVMAGDSRSNNRGPGQAGHDGADVASDAEGTDLPVVSSPAAKNISLFDLVDTAIEHYRPALIRRGVTRRHERGAGDAMDALGAQDGRLQSGRRSRVVLAPRRWCQVLEKQAS
jgi:hypothetical protein